MEQKTAVFDFAGTLIRSEIIEEANEFRARILTRSLPSRKEHSYPDGLYKANNEFVERLTGLTKDMTIRYRKNDLDYIDIQGDAYQNQISTNLFQIGMYMVAKKYGVKIFQEGLISELTRIKTLGYRLIIISGVRTDIISGMLQIAKIPVKFDHIIGQPPILGVTNAQNFKAIKNASFVIGDKLSDLLPAKKNRCKTIFVTWGHAQGKENDFADYTIDEPKELKKIIK